MKLDTLRHSSRVILLIGVLAVLAAGTGFALALTQNAHASPVDTSHLVALIGPGPRTTPVKLPPPATLTAIKGLPPPPTQTPTDTGTATNTATFTPSATNTSTNTSIPPTATSTATGTPLPPTATNTSTSTDTSTNTATGTNTNTPLPTNTAISTPTCAGITVFTATPATTGLPAFTSTFTPVVPGCASFTPTNTPTASATGTATRTSTATNTPTFGPSPTPTKTLVPSNTPLPTNTLTPSNTATATLTPSATFVTATPYPLINATLTVDNTSPKIGDTITFILTAQNPSTGVALSQVFGTLQINGTTMLTPNPVNYSPVNPGDTKSFTFTHVVNSGDTCSLNPLATVGGYFNNTVALTPVNPTLATPITVQKVGLTFNSLYGPSSTSVGSALYSAVLVTNSGCLSENVTGSLLINGAPTGDPVTPGTSGTVPPGSTITLYSSHFVQSSNVNNGAVPLAYSLSAVAVSNPALPAATLTSPTANIPVITVTATSIGGGGGNGTVTLIKSANTTAAHSGDAIIFTVTMSNISTGPLTLVTLSDDVDATTMTVVSAKSDIGAAVVNGNNVTAAIGTIPAGSAAHLTIQVKVLTSVKSPALLNNSATGTFNGGTPLTASISIPVVTGTGNGGVIGGGIGGLPITGNGAPMESQSSLPIGVIVAAAAILSLMGAGAYVIVRHVR